MAKTPDQFSVNIDLRIAPEIRERLLAEVEKLGEEIAARLKQAICGAL
jgi:hypothetical protein